MLETDLSRGAANSFSVYMSVHVMVSDCVSVRVLLVCFAQHYNMLNINVLHHPHSSALMWRDLER